MHPETQTHTRARAKWTTTYLKGWVGALVLDAALQCGERFRSKVLDTLLERPSALRELGRLASHEIQRALKRAHAENVTYDKGRQRTQKQERVSIHMNIKLNNAL